jgi:hypothetical protein
VRLLARELGSSPASVIETIRRGTFTSVKHLIAKIGAFIDGWNDC